jgi:hypothetical protein
MMTVDALLEQLEILNKTYLWTVKESETILAQTDEAWASEDMQAVERLRNQFMELQNRHRLDKTQYNLLINSCKDYFKKKFGIDLLSLFELEDI